LGTTLFRKAQDWLAKQRKPSPEDFACWLDDNGGKLDRRDVARDAPAPPIIICASCASFHQL
jgi:hypothetical protein